jgi:Ribbon-helix-helix protein, copG family
MVRIQIQLDPSQHRQLRQRSKRLGVSVSEMVRRCITGHLQSLEPEGRGDRVRRALAVVGKYADPRGRTDIGRGHDAALSEAYRR